MAGHYEWDEIDEQMAREAEARTRSMHSVNKQRRAFKSKDTLVPGKAGIPRGNGPSDVFQSAAQTLAATSQDRQKWLRSR